MDIMQNLSNWLGGGVEGVSNMFEKRFPDRRPRSAPSAPQGGMGGMGGMGGLGRMGGGGLGGGLGGMLGGLTGAGGNGGAGVGGLGGLLGPSVLGGLAGALLGRNRGGRGMGGVSAAGGGGLGSMITGALIAGGGQMLWNKYKDRIREENQQAKPDYGVAAPASEQAVRMIRALVYAAKADGHIDERERAAIDGQLREMNIGETGERLVKQAMDEPLDPAVIARGVKNEDEALQLFTVSTAIIDLDNFMERSYLDGLAQALGIPADVKSDLEAKIKAPAQT